MSWRDTWRSLTALDDDVLAQHRQRTVVKISTALLVMLLPVGLYGMFIGRVLPAFAVLVGACALAGNVWALRHARLLPVPLWLVSAALVIAVLAATETTPVYGVLWAYPTLMVLFLFLPPRWALLQAVLLIVAVSGLALRDGGVPLAGRVAMTLAFMVFMMAIVVGVFSSLQRELVRQTLTDPLTGAYNRRHLQTLLDAAAESRRRHARSQVLLLIDIDHFKRVNDEFGHAAGDSVLCRVVALINGRKRRHDPLFRAGGEEFVLLLSDTLTDAALMVAEDIRLRIAQDAIVPGRSLTVSIGVSSLPPDTGIDAWMKAADDALYAAKHGGRNRVVAATWPQALPHVTAHVTPVAAPAPAAGAEV